jgi:D-methionine transport system permease protein
VRSTPFIILLVAVIPMTLFRRHLHRHRRGHRAADHRRRALHCTPGRDRLREVDHGLVEAAQAMGATTWQIIYKVLVPEAFAGIVAGLTITFVSLVGYSAMAGAIGGGGLGDLGIRYGYQRFLPEVMLAVVLILIVFVSWCNPGRPAGRKLSHR